jgi:hypothetical protein
VAARFHPPTPTCAGVSRELLTCVRGSHYIVAGLMPMINCGLENRWLSGRRPQTTQEDDDVAIIASSNTGDVYVRNILEPSKLTRP